MTTELHRDQTPQDMAAEYVLGTMSESERIEFESRLLDDRKLQAEVAAWEQRLSPLLEAVEPVQPTLQVWRNLERRIGSNTGLFRLWNSLGFWRNLAIAASSAVIILSLTTGQMRHGGAEMDQMLVVMNDQSQAGWIVSADSSGATLKVKAVAPTEMPAGEFCQLWMEGSDGKPMPVGALPHSGSESMPIPAVLTEGSKFQVTVENTSSGPMQQPSDRIVFAGHMIKM
jgi:anti-sigma-K factor RskA